MQNWFGIITGIFLCWVAYKIWEDPFKANLYDDIKNWDDVNDENRTQFNIKRYGVSACFAIIGPLFLIFSKEATSFFHEQFFDLNAFLTMLF